MTLVIGIWQINNHGKSSEHLQKQVVHYHHLHASLTPLNMEKAHA
jgi:hypothetical protein